MRRKTCQGEGACTREGMAYKEGRKDVEWPFCSVEGRGSRVSCHDLASLPLVHRAGTTHQAGDLMRSVRPS